MGVACVFGVGVGISIGSSVITGSSVGIAGVGSSIGVGAGVSAATGFSGSGVGVGAIVGLAVGFCTGLLVGNAGLARPFTTTVNSFVSTAVPRMMYAVSVTAVLFSGRVTLPDASIISSLLLSHEIVLPLLPFSGSVSFTVTDCAMSPGA